MRIQDLCTDPNNIKALLTALQAGQGSMKERSVQVPDELIDATSAEMDKVSQDRHALAIEAEQTHVSVPEAGIITADSTRLSPIKR